MLHKKSLAQRSEELKKYINLIEACINEETEYLGKLQLTLDDPNEVIIDLRILMSSVLVLLEEK
jgi:hypothetical protein